MKGFLLILAFIIILCSSNVSSIHLKQMVRASKRNNNKDEFYHVDFVKKANYEERNNYSIDKAYFSIHIAYEEKYQKPFEHGTLITTLKDKDEWVCYDITYSDNQMHLEVSTSENNERCKNKFSFDKTEYKIEKKINMNDIINYYYDFIKLVKSYDYKSIAKKVDDFKENLDPKKGNCLTFLLFCAEKFDKTSKLRSQLEETILTKAEALKQLLKEKEKANNH